MPLRMFLSFPLFSWRNFRICVNLIGEFQILLPPNKQEFLNACSARDATAIQELYLAKLKRLGGTNMDIEVIDNTYVDV